MRQRDDSSTDIPPGVDPSDAPDYGPTAPPIGPAASALPSSLPPFPSVVQSIAQFPPLPAVPVPEQRAPPQPLPAPGQDLPPGVDQNLADDAAACLAQVTSAEELLPGPPNAGTLAGAPPWLGVDVKRVDGQLDAHHASLAAVGAEFRGHNVTIKPEEKRRAEQREGMREAREKSEGERRRRLLAAAAEAVKKSAPAAPPPPRRNAAGTSSQRAHAGSAQVAAPKADRALKPEPSESGEVVDSDDEADDAKSRVPPPPAPRGKRDLRYDKRR